jgi:hypothetical protein
LVLSLHQVQFLRYRTVIFEATLAYSEETWGAREREEGMRYVEKRRGGRKGGRRAKESDKQRESACAYQETARYK